MSKTNVVWEHRTNGGRFMTPYTKGSEYGDNEHHVVVAIDVDDAEGRKLCDERINQTASAFLNDLPEELRDPGMDAEIREMIGADPISDERKMEMPIPWDAGPNILNPIVTLTNSDIEANIIVFYVDSGKTEALKLSGNGDIYVHGRLVENDKEVVQGLRDFLKAVPKSQN